MQDFVKLLSCAGLPEYWKRDDHSNYKQGSFDLEGQFPAVGPNVHLIKGLFNESLPRFLKKQAAYGAADAPMTFLHIDCDLYRGAAEVFKLVAHKIVPGTVIVFDDLVSSQPALYGFSHELLWFKLISEIKCLSTSASCER